jgi:two-component sensor histidine kinase
MDSVVLQPTTIPNPPDILDQISAILPLLADLSRADILLCAPASADEMKIIAHARPHSIAPSHRSALIGRRWSRDKSDALFRAIAERQYVRGTREYPRPPINGEASEGALAPVVQEAYPIEDETGKVIAGLLIETSLLESERLKRRSDVFQRALRSLQQMALGGKPDGITTLSEFGEHDGVIILDGDRVIRYMSGIATNLYRVIGYTEPLVGKPLDYLETRDEELVRRAMDLRVCVQLVTEERSRIWIKKAIPILRPERIALLRAARENVTGAILLIHDDTETRQRERELSIKTTMIKELHHRVKNDLQTVASLLRMQSRRLKTDEAKAALSEAVNRILSISVIHEFLSAQDTRIINIREVAQRIVQQMQSALIDPARHITLSVVGPNIFLPARQATSCALVINELFQNALEHGYGTREAGGTIALTFQDHGDAVGLIVHDDGHGLPKDFSLNKIDSLGLKIVQMLVTEDLKGEFSLESNHGVSANVRFPKIPLGGDETWNEHA